MKVLGLLTLILIPIPEIAESSVFVKRTELFDVFQNEICQSIDNVKNLDHKKLWSLGVYDSQIKVSIIQPEKSQSIPTSSMKLAAKIQLKNSQHRSYIFGKCKNQYGWIATFPSSHNLENILKKKSLTKICKKFSIDSIPQDLRHNLTNLTVKKDFISASITCQPVEPIWMGPQEWFLIKGNQVDDLSTNLLDEKNFKHMPKEISHESIFLVINKLRILKNIRPLQKNSELDEISERLSRTKSINHNSKRLKVLSNFVKDVIPSLKKTAETRVIAKDLNEFVELVSLSPNHRKMILAPDATMLGVHIKKIKEKSLVVLTTGEVHLKKPTASNPPAKKANL